MARDFAKSFYHSAAWLKCRDAFLKSRHYQCERCGGPAVIVHHVQHITPGNISNPDITLNWDNLEALCLECHNNEHGTQGATREGLAFDENGNLVQTPRSRRTSRAAQDRAGPSKNLSTTTI